MDFLHSPTSTECYLTCPTLWDLSRRWQARDETWEPKMLAGTAIHAGLAAYYLKLGIAPEEAAKRELRAGWVEQDRWQYDAVEKIVLKGLAKAISADPFEGWSILSVEDRIGNGVVDLRARNLKGELCIIDHKTTWSLKSEWIPDRLSEYEHSWQVRGDYPARVTDHYGEPVLWSIVNLIILTPTTKVIPHPTKVDQGWLDRWRKDAASVWKRMGGDHHWRNLRACHNKGLHYGGRCPMYALCHDLNGDERLAPTLYATVPPRDPSKPVEEN